MYDHIGLKVKDLDAAVRFYSAALAPLGHVLCTEGDSYAGLGPKGEPALWLYVAKDAKGPGVHAIRPPSSASTGKASRPAAEITASPDCASTTAPTTTPRFCSIRTATMWRRCS
jgi:catechol 2,3-dioxygenase-like lactoylglutathione lyase family enzyme